MVSPGENHLQFSSEYELVLIATLFKKNRNGKERVLAGGGEEAEEEEGGTDNKDSVNPDNQHRGGEVGGSGVGGASLRKPRKFSLRRNSTATAAGGEAKIDGSKTLKRAAEKLGKNSNKPPHPSAHPHAADTPGSNGPTATRKSSVSSSSAVVPAVSSPSSGLGGVGGGLNKNKKKKKFLARGGGEEEQETKEEGGKGSCIYLPKISKLQVCLYLRLYV